MNKLFLCFLLSLLLPQIFYGKTGLDQKHTAVFGRHDNKLGKQHSNRVRIFLDKDGNYYPSGTVIKNGDLRANGSSLATWYNNNPGDFKEICVRYGVSTGSMEGKISQLNQAIADKLAKEIEEKSAGKTRINYYIHGFNKKAWNGDFLFNPSSRVDNNKVRRKISSGQSEEMLYVEVYWDANKMSSAGSAIANKGYKLFASSTTPSAERVGLALRRLFVHMPDMPINIITHSTGALVACELLFNASTAPLPLDKVLPTPTQSHIKVCLVAPAIGADRFKHYLERASLTIKPADDKYKIAVVYNTNDYILRKNRRILLVVNYPNSTPDDFASTRMGCNYDQDLELMRTYVGAANTTFFDLSHKRGKPRVCHLITNCYLHNHVKFEDVKTYLLK